MGSRKATGKKGAPPAGGAPTRCLPESVLAELAEGRLADPAATDAEAHVEACPTCRRVLAELVRG
jgi:hypothetical protein